MILKNHKILGVGCLILSFVFSFSTLHSQESPGHDIKQFRNLTEAIKGSEELLAKYRDSDFTPNVMFQLVELYAKRSVLKFQREMLVFEQAENNFERGLLKTEPNLPRIDYSAAIKLAAELLQKFPNVGFRDKVIYRIAYCQLETGNGKKAMEYFDQLAEETNDKQLLEESYFRLGEHYFETKAYDKAVVYYDRLLSSWDSPYFDMALYKLGWCYYNVDDFSQSIGTFLFLIEDSKLLERLETELGKTKADLRDEAIKNISINFAEFGGAAKAGEFLKEYKDKDFTEEILQHLAEIFKKRNFYEEAVETLNVLIGFYPYKPKSAIAQKAIVDNYELAGEKGRADVERAKLVDQYGPGSPWLKQIPAGKVRQEILGIAEEFLYTLGSEAHERARQSANSVASYELAIIKYKEFIEKFEFSDRAQKVQFYLAECFYETGKFREAAESYYDVILKYPNSELREISAYNQVLAYDHLLQKDTVIDSTEFHLFNFLGKGKTQKDTLNVLNSNQAQLLQACNDFYLFHSESPNLPEVLMNYAQILYELEYIPLAREVYQKVVEHSPANPMLPQAYMMLAQCDFKQEYYLEADLLFQNVVKLFPDSSRYVSKANKMIASSRFKNAEMHLQKGDSTLAAQEFEKISTLTADPAIAEQALFEAALQYENIGRKNKSVELYEMMSLQFPGSHLIDESFFKAGVLSEELENWQRAATNYLALFKHDPNSRYASRSLFFAAKCYETAGDLSKARTYFQEYIINYAVDPDRYVEAAFRRGEIAYNQNSLETALKDFQFVIDAHQKFVEQNISIESYVPANAQFLTAEIFFKFFDKIKLKPPLKRNLKRKRSAFAKVIKAYTEAAKFKVADWTTASSYKIGVTFEAFADAVFKSPRPRNLSGEDLNKYDDKLWETVVPFKEKALETYRANLKQAAENSIENNWVLQSRKRVEALVNELGLAQVKLSQEGGS